MVCIIKEIVKCCFINDIDVNKKMEVFNVELKKIFYEKRFISRY